MTQTLTVVGASARAAAQSAVRAGLSVHAGDLFADADLTRICNATRVAAYPHGLAEVICGLQDGGWMYTGALENHARLVGQWSRHRLLWGNGASTLRRVRDPRRIVGILRAAGLHAPDVAPQGTIPRGDEHWLLKPLRSAGGNHIGRWSADTRPPRDLHSRWYFQRYVEGLACSAAYLAVDGRCMLLGVTRQLSGQPWTGADGFRYCGSIGPISPSRGTIRAFAEIGAVLARECKLVGLYGVDAIINSAAVWPVEVNPRFTSSMELIDRAQGVSLVGLHVAACRDGRLPPELPPARYMCGKAIVFAPKRLVINEVLMAPVEEPGATPPSLADIPAPGTAIEAGWPIVTVLADGHTEAEVLEKLRHHAGQVTAKCGEL